jgi:hypothetical protein
MTESKKVGRPLRGKKPTVKRSVTMTPAAWAIVQALADKEGRSVSAALERIVLDSKK